jgi:HemY protein
LAFVFGFFGFLFRLPSRLSQRAKARRHAKGHAALSRGMIAVGAGDAHVARRSAAEATRHLQDEPLALLLGAQAAQMSGDRAGAEAAFGKLAQEPATRLLGLRGLHVEAQRRGDHEAALHFAQEAHKMAPLSWSAKAVLDHRAAQGQWENALAALESQISAKLIDKKTGERQRAVLETAIAMDKETGSPEEALHLARKALARAPDLVPAAVLTARLLARKGETRKAAKTIESAWDRQPHPELAEVYLDLRPGDSNADRLGKARALAKIAPHHPESHMIVARAALAARDFKAAREAMAPLIEEDQRPTARMCLVMAELEDTETGDEGKVREWLARGARAPRDPVWMADGVAASKWAPVSPVTGRLDAFVWQTPPDRLGTAIDSGEWIAHAETPARLAPPPPAEMAPAPAESEPVAIEPPEPASKVEVMPPSPSEPVAATPIQALRGSARSGQKVIFPMPAAPDDPGPNDVREDKDRVGSL